MRDSATVDQCHTRLKRASWSLGEVRLLTATGPVWLVDGTNGENRLEARGATQAEAWCRAVEQAMALGMAGGRQGG
jgi:hypothetical protein